jgi:3',5'-cyclic AMP phosphodiesterase CpdA
MINPVTRRSFLKGSAAVSAAVALSGNALHPQDSSPKAVFYLPPFLARPTENSIFISVLTNDKPVEAILEYRRQSDESWQRLDPPEKAPEFQFLNWDLKDLLPETRYSYRILAKRASESDLESAAKGSFITQRKSPASYTAVLITDPHTGTFAEDSGPVLTLDKVIENASKEKAEFVLALGDNVAWNGSREYAQTNTQGAVGAYAMYRSHIGPLTQSCPHFGIIGNWAGESGKFPEQNIRLVTQIRQAFLPNPNETTYPQGGNKWEDYYAFSWGDVLYVMLNIQTYSEPSDLGGMDSLSSDVSRVEDWTIGQEQMAWLKNTLQNATESYRFVCMHHPAGGNAGNPHDTLYGRGGARCWNSGEQLKIHNLMKQHGVQVFFYGHDHVFVDDVVDDIHYTLPGSCGAPWKFTKEETGYERYWPDSGHARLEVTPEKATVTFVNLEGEDFYDFSVSPIKT